MHNSERFRLHFRPYRTPRFRVGQKLQCEVLGEVTIYRISSARIPWPVGPRRSLVVFGALARALRRESALAICHWWGVAPCTVSKWRQVLGVQQNNAGTLLLRQGYGEEEWFAKAQRKAWSKARDPVRRAKIAAARRGKPRPRYVVFAMSERMSGRKLSAATRQRMSEAHKARGTRPPKAGRPWEPWEDELARKLPVKEAAGRTGRTLSAVQNRRQALRLPDGRSKTERKRLGR
jgi:hypothetical protein